MSRSGLRLAARRAWIVALGLACGCATYSDRTGRARDALTRGDRGASIHEFNRILKVRTADEVPDKLGKDGALALLERATVLQADTQYALSARDFAQADKSLEMLDLSRDAAGKIGKYIYSDSAGVYRTTPTEKLALNALAALDYLVLGDVSGARIEVRRHQVIRDYLKNAEPDRVPVALGAYLGGFVAERDGAWDEAMRYYDEALARGNFATLHEAITRLGPRTSYRTPRLEGVLAEATPPSNDSPSPQTEPSPPGAELLVVTKLGRVPHKEPRRIPIGAAVGLASAHISGDTRVLEHGLFKVVVYPELVSTRTHFDRAEVQVDGRPIRAELAADFSAEIVHEHELAKPRIIGAALTRMIARAVAAEAGRAAGRQADNVVGFLAAALVEGTLVALDRPDTRSWTTLASRVLVSRVTVPPGERLVSVTFSGSGGTTTRSERVRLQAGAFQVLDFTNLQ